MLDKTFDSAEIQARIYAQWEKSGAFAAHPDSPKRPFCIMMPPPNVTGSLHMGHALNHTLQDILIRFERMRGRDALWQPGTDHAGIATQMVVERQLEQGNISRQDMGRGAFIDRVWKWKAESGGAITRQLRALGASPDWSRERFTMDEGLSTAVRKVFVALHKEGLIYRDKRLVNWDPRLHTAVSDLEVESRETKGSLWYVNYPIDGRPGEFITVATTRPETMLGDTGVAVNPKDERYRAFVGRHAILPLVGRNIPIIADEYADPATGSGAVKITPAHDFNDFAVGQRHRLPFINVLDRDARLNENAPAAYRGMDRFAARKKILADLEAGGFLAKTEPHSLTVPYGDRSGVVLEPWLTDQWYVDAKTLAKPAIEAVERGATVFVPRQWENTFFEWMRNIQPWCVSRQIWWGHQIPAWYAPDGKVFVEETEAEAMNAAARHYGTPTPLQRDEDVLDTWFSSALWPFSTLGWPEQTKYLARYYPTDVLVTGFDIIFFWVARMMMMGLKFMGEVPFRTVYIHALVRDERGQKMSKSKGNIVDPIATIETYGCDALRFTLTALAAQGRDIKLSTSRIEGYRNFATKLWNAARFAEMNECKLDPKFDPAKARLTVNRWIGTALWDAVGQIEIGFGDFSFNHIANTAYQYVWGTFCDWYLEFTKPILTGDDEAAKTETRAMTAWVLSQIVRLLHPIMPFITEELWHHFTEGKAGLLITSKWPEDPFYDGEAFGEINWVIGLIEEIRALRSDLAVPPGAMLAAYVQHLGDSAGERIIKYLDQIKKIARVTFMPIIEMQDGHAMLQISHVIAPTMVQLIYLDSNFTLNLMGTVDLGKERARLRKEAAAVRGELDKIAAKLDNEQFVAKAKPEAVEEQRERESQARAALARLDAALERIGGA